MLAVVGFEIALAVRGVVTGFGLVAELEQLGELVVSLEGRVFRHDNWGR